MIRLLGGLLLPLLAGLWIVSIAPEGRGQDPFQAAGESATKEQRSNVQTARDSSAIAKEPERIVKTNDEWAKQLTHEQFLVTRMKSTEPAFSGKYASGHFKGTFLCVCCGAKLFDAKHKFESGTGWPSFWRPVSENAVDTAWDYSEPSEARVEVVCHRCGSHLGHVFQDGPPPTGLRFCMNSAALKLDTEKAASTPARKTTKKQAAKTTAKSRSMSGKSGDKTQTAPASDPAPKS